MEEPNDRSTSVSTISSILDVNSLGSAQRGQSSHYVIRKEEPPANQGNGRLSSKIGNKITAYVRVRPRMLSDEGATCFVEVDSTKITIDHPYDDSIIDCFTVDAILIDDKARPPESDVSGLPVTTNGQYLTYKSVGAPLLKWAIDGYNTALIAYGGRNSGKTYSMIGTETAPGILPCLTSGIFSSLSLAAHAAEKAGVKLGSTVHFSAVTVTKSDTVLCLLNKDAKCVIHESPTGIFIEGATRVLVHSTSDLRNALRQANSKAKTITKRHHVIYIFEINQHACSESKGGSFLGNEVSSTMYFYDLKGEQTPQTFADKSLKAFHSLIKELSEGKHTTNSHSDSNLTRLMKIAIGGNSRTCLLATICDCATFYTETFETLRTCERIRNVSNICEVNEPLLCTTVRSMMAEIASLKQQLQRTPPPPPVELKPAELNAIALQDVPHLVNLDPHFESGEALAYPIRPGESYLGTDDPQPNLPNDEKVEIRLKNHFNVSNPHCILDRLATGEVEYIPVNGSLTYLNGNLLTHSVTLRHNDRLIIGSNHAFVFWDPKAAKLEHLKPCIEPKIVNWEYASKEFAEQMALISTEGAERSLAAQLAENEAELARAHKEIQELQTQLQVPFLVVISQSSTSPTAIEQTPDAGYCPTHGSCSSVYRLRKGLTSVGEGLDISPEGCADNPMFLECSEDFQSVHLIVNSHRVALHNGQRLWSGKNEFQLVLPLCSKDPDESPASESDELSSEQVLEEIRHRLFDLQFQLLSVRDSTFGTVTEAELIEAGPERGNPMFEESSEQWRRDQWLRSDAIVTMDGLRASDLIRHFDGLLLEVRLISKEVFQNVQQLRDPEPNSQPHKGGDHSDILASPLSSLSSSRGSVDDASPGLTSDGDARCSKGGRSRSPCNVSVAISASQIVSISGDVDDVDAIEITGLPFPSLPNSLSPDHRVVIPQLDFTYSPTLGNEPATGRTSTSDLSERGTYSARRFEEWKITSPKCKARSLSTLDAQVNLLRSCLSSSQKKPARLSGGLHGVSLPRSASASMVNQRREKCASIDSARHSLQLCIQTLRDVAESNSPQSARLPFPSVSIERMTAMSPYQKAQLMKACREFVDSYFELSPKEKEQLMNEYTQLSINLSILVRFVRVKGYDDIVHSGRSPSPRETRESVHRSNSATSVDRLQSRSKPGASDAASRRVKLDTSRGKQPPRNSQATTTNTSFSKGAVPKVALRHSLSPFPSTRSTISPNPPRTSLSPHKSRVRN